MLLYVHNNVIETNNCCDLRFIRRCSKDKIRYIKQHVKTRSKTNALRFSFVRSFYLDNYRL